MNPFSLSFRLSGFLTLLLHTAALPGNAQEKDTPWPPPLAPAEPLSLLARRTALPTVWIAGDSTAAMGPAAATGWGVPFSSLLEPGKVTVVNGARGGRSSRTFITEGLWDAMCQEIKAGDWVLIQFGHNDAGPVNDTSRARGSLRTTGEETQEIDNMVTKKPETVHGYGWYMRKMIGETKAKGATPVVLALTVRNKWKDGKVERRNGPWNHLAQETARTTGTAFLDLTGKIANAYDHLGPEKVKQFFPRDHTHTGRDGAAFTARLLIEALRDLKVPGLPATQF